jgi:hypothetical protein
MTEEPKPNEANDPQEPLSPALCDAVAEILARPVPEELSRRVLEAVRQQVPPKTRRPIGRLALVALLATAASIGVALLGWRLLGSRAPGPIPGPSGPPAVAHDPAVPVAPLPTLWAYQQAAKESPEALESLLDRHARQLLPPEPPLRTGFLPSSAGGIL